jgi:putative Mn2+ efflux pump MntP
MNVKRVAMIYLAICCGVIDAVSVASISGIQVRTRPTKNILRSGLIRLTSPIYDAILSPQEENDPNPGS